MLGKRSTWLRALLGGILLVSSALGAQAAEFKNITIMVGYGAGAGYDQTSRLVARYLGKYLPGNPSIVVQNTPGGGSLKLTKMLMGGSLPADGSVLGSISEAMVIAPVLDPANADFDAKSIRWIGSLSNEPAFCLASKKSGIDTLDKFLGSDFLVGASGKSSSTYLFAAMVKNGLGAKFSIVTGFEGSAEIMLAMDRGEIGAVCAIASNGLFGRENDLSIIGTFGEGTPPDHPDLKRFSSLIKDPVQRKAAELLESTFQFHYPIMLPPGTPDETVAQFRKAYTQMYQNPEFVAEAKKMGFQINAMSGEDIDKLVATQLSSGADVMEAARNITK